MYDPDKVIAYYNELGQGEWERLDNSAHARLIYHLHMHFLRDHIGPGKKVLDAGCGAGRFAVSMAQAGSQITLLDISEEQISLAKANLTELDLLERSAGFLVGDICDLTCFADHTFDVTVNFGGALNYLFDRADLALRELVRVTRPGGMVLVSVMSRWGVFRYVAGNDNLDPKEFLGRSNYWMIHQVAETGDLLEHPDMRHPARHFFDSVELKELLENAGLEEVILGSTPSISAALYARLALIEEEPAAWDTLLQLEEAAYCLPGLLDTGEHLLAKGRVPG
jgi:ubiquinone/menaquinone biosynthesis C-methylase UbiE